MDPPPPPIRLAASAASPPTADPSRLRCQRHPACVRGFKHGGAPGACRVVSEAAAEAAAQAAAEAEHEAEHEAAEDELLLQRLLWAWRRYGL